MRPYALPDGFIHTRRAYNEGRAFVFTVQTTASPETFTLPLEAGGSYDFTVDWGDSNSDNVTVWNDAAVTHSYAGAGTYTITIVGIIQGWLFNNGGDKTKIYDIKEWGPLRLGNSGGYFYGCSNLTVSAVDVLNLTDNTTLYYAFHNCSSLTTLDVSTWDTANITTLYNAFGGCSSLTALDVSTWNTANITSLRSTFQDCSSLTTLDVSAWDTANVTSFYNIFKDCSSLTTLDVSSWNTANVATIYSAFNGCTSLTTLDVSTWDTANVTTFAYTFYNCTSLTTLDVSAWDTANVTTFSSAFRNTLLTVLDVSSWDVTATTTMANMLAFVTLTTVSYSNLLIAFEAQAVLNNVSLHGGNSKYSAGAAATARAALIADHTWVITDAGPA